MMYRIPMPSRSNGIKLHTFGDHSIGVEYTTGEPHVGKLAYDSSCGILAKNISFRRPEIERIVADAVREVDRQDAAMMPKAGIKRSKDMEPDTMEYDDDATEVLSKLMDFLQGKLDADDLDVVSQILSSGETDGDKSARNANPSEIVGAVDPTAYGADDRAIRRRSMSPSTEASYLKMFPQANRLA